MDNLEKNELVEILKDFISEETVDDRISQLAMPLSELSDKKWVPFLPERVREKWDGYSMETRCIIQRLCLQIADSETIIKDYSDAFTEAKKSGSKK